ncbi:MAG: DUF1499 domain-containing protein [Caldilineaceae bacterium]
MTANRMERLSTAIFPLSPGAHGSTFDRQQKRFAPCPDSPNCVSTQAPPTDKLHAIAPIAYTGDRDAAHQRLLAVIQAMPRATVITTEPEYIYAEFRSRLMSFVDDVEFYLDDAAKQIHFRSASRLGRGDLGVNRQRMEEIRRRFGE